jgi:hypothetical protein
MLLAISLLFAIGWIVTARDGVDRAGHPLGTDFLSFWTASDLALHGIPAAAYDPAVHGARERALFPDYTDGGYTAFFYPPTYLLVCLPLALLPYFWSLAAWLGLTFAAYWRGLRMLLPGPGMALPILAYPALLPNAGYGQNAFLTTALFAGAASWLGPRPLLAGLCLGGLCVKPHLCLLIPITLLAGRHWRALAGAVAGATLLCLTATALFGVESWRGFLAVAPIARATLELGLVRPAKMVSVFAAARLLAAPVPLAYAAQALAALAGAAVVIRARHAGATTQVAALIAATLMTTPFLLDYDLTLAAVPLAVMFARARTDGFLPWEKLAMAAAFMLPLVARVLATRLSLPIAPLVEAALLAVVARRSHAIG